MKLPSFNLRELLALTGLFSVSLALPLVGVFPEEYAVLFKLTTIPLVVVFAYWSNDRFARREWLLAVLVFIEMIAMRTLSAVSYRLEDIEQLKVVHYLMRVNGWMEIVTPWLLGVSCVATSRREQGTWLPWGKKPVPTDGEAGQQETSV